MIEATEADVTSQVRAIEEEQAYSLRMVEDHDRLQVDQLVASLLSSAEAIREERKRLLNYRRDLHTTEARILVIDDDPSLRAMMRRTLVVPGRVDAVGSVAAAIDLVQRHRYDLAFVDIVLGTGIEGDEAIPILRAKSLARNLPVVLMSAYFDDRELERRMRASGANKFLAKPFEVWALRAIVDLYTDPAIRGARPSA